MSYKIENINKTYKLQKIKQEALNYISYRHRSKNEIYLKLKSKNFDLKDINMVLSELESLGLIDDELFAKQYAESLIKNKLYSKKAVFIKLYKYKISRDVLGSVIDKLYLETSEKKIINKLFKKKNIAQESSRKEIFRFLNFLKRKGFNWEDIKAVSDKIGIRF